MVRRMSLDTATKKSVVLADSLTRATRAAKAFPALGSAPGLSAAGGPGIGAAALREALAPLETAIGAVLGEVTTQPGGVELATRMNTA